MSTKLFIITFIVIATEIKGFVVTKEDPVLPKAYIDQPESLIVRVQPNNIIKYVKCPEGTRFDTTTLTCEFSTKRITGKLKSVNNDSSICMDNNGFPVANIVPDPTNCRYFYLCGAGTSTRMACQNGLLFHKEISACDWPRQAQCCEFPGGDPLKLVVPQPE